MSKLLIVVTLATLSAATPALAQGRGMMTRADANGDGAISRVEYKAQVDARFSTMDTDHDGTLAGTEMSGPGGRGGAGMMRADTDGDGKVSRAEYTIWADRRFARMDANADGTISADELSAVAARARSRATDPAEAIPTPTPSGTPKP